VTLLNSIDSFAIGGYATTISFTNLVGLDKHQFSLDQPILSEKDALFYLTVYACLGLANIAVDFLREFIVLIGGFWASRKLHKNLLHAILYSPLRFFETTPVGYRFPLNK
jgi:hypothetical protein